MKCLKYLHLIISLLAGLFVLLGASWLLHPIAAQGIEANETRPGLAGPDGHDIYLSGLQFTRVVDQNDTPISDTQIYADGQFLGLTDQDGLLSSTVLTNGTNLVVLAQQAEQTTTREVHDGWAYRTYLTNLTLDADGEPQPFIADGPGEQKLTVLKNQPLILFNLVLSIEWDATVTYTNQISQAVQHASNYLYDLTDGQMALGRVVIYDEGGFWAEADIQISASNDQHPYAYVGGLVADETFQVIHVGRFWDGYSGDQGPWNEPAGYHTLMHEFGHYALYLHDEYFMVLTDGIGNPVKVYTDCTGPENDNLETEAVNASVMDNHYASTELSELDILWGAGCEETEQWRLNAESSWHTLVSRYADTEVPARWQLTTPLDRGSVLTGPAVLPADLLPFPQVEVNNQGIDPPPRHLTVYGPNGVGFQNAIVTLHQNGFLINQGLTNSQGKLEIYGAVEGSQLWAMSLDGGLEGSLIVPAGTDLSLTMSSPGWRKSGRAEDIPRLRVTTQANKGSDQVDLMIDVQNLDAEADLNLSLTGPDFNQTSRYSGRYQEPIKVYGAPKVGYLWLDSDWGHLHTTYRLQRLTADQHQDIYSPDGNFHLNLGPDSLPMAMDEVVFVVATPGTIPGPLPEGLALVGHPYEVTASEAITGLRKPALLNLHYDLEQVKSLSSEEALALYQWLPANQSWQALPSRVNREHQEVTASTQRLGVYALLTPVDQHRTLYLPFVFK